MRSSSSIKQFDDFTVPQAIAIALKRLERLEELETTVKDLRSQLEAAKGPTQPASEAEVLEDIQQLQAKLVSCEEKAQQDEARISELEAANRKLSLDSLPKLEREKAELVSAKEDLLAAIEAYEKAIASKDARIAALE